MEADDSQQRDVPEATGEPGAWRASRLSLVSLAFGVLSWGALPAFVVGLPAAILFGVLAVREIRGSGGRLYGVGFVIGGVLLAAGVPLGIALSGP